MAQDSGLWKRGIVVFAIIGLLAAIVLAIVFRRPQEQQTSRTMQTQQVIAVLSVPTHAGIGTLPWGGYYQLAEELPSPKGWPVRYAATIAFARSGSERLPLNLMREMLDEKRQQVNYSRQDEKGETSTNQAAAQELTLNALKSFVEWHKKTQGENKFSEENADLQKVYQAIHQLAQSSNETLKYEAKIALQEMGRSG